MCLFLMVSNILLLNVCVVCVVCLDGKKCGSLKSYRYIQYVYVCVCGAVYIPVVDVTL